MDKERMAKMEKRDYNLNVMKYGYGSWNIINWPNNIKNFFRSFKRAAERIKYGYCYWDLWDMDCYLDSLISRMLDDLAENSMGYPGNEEFNTDEKWHDYLKKLSADFFEIRKMSDDDDDDDCPVFDWERTENEDGSVFYKAKKDEEKERQWNEWMDKWKQKQNGLEKLKDNAFTRLSHVWNNLWD